MKVSEAGIALIKRFEGCRLEPYLDVGGVPTCGFGHTGPSVVMGHAWTQQEADDTLDDDLVGAEKVINDLGLNLTQGQLDALVSFVFNLGGRALLRSTLLKLLRAADFDGAADEFPKWSHANGKVVAGLLVRREAERAMFLGVA